MADGKQRQDDKNAQESGQPVQLDKEQQGGQHGAKRDDAMKQGGAQKQGGSQQGGSQQGGSQHGSGQSGQGGQTR
jgi:hypothetical protein